MTLLVAFLCAGLTVRAVRSLPELALVLIGLGALASFAWFVLSTQ